MRTAASVPMCWNICRMNCVLQLEQNRGLYDIGSCDPDLLAWLTMPKSNPVGAFGQRHARGAGAGL